MKQDCFLNPAEHAEWASRMKLDQDEPQPVLRPSQFLCFASEPQEPVLLPVRIMGGGIRDDYALLVSGHVTRRVAFFFTQSASEQGPVRELSLWEWRHWQNRPFPTHRVEHSDRCRHFNAVMELIDQMKLEPEVRASGAVRVVSRGSPGLKSPVETSLTQVPLKP